MRQLLLIAADEWRYWLRSHLALGGIVLFVMLYIVTNVLVAQGMYEENARRTHQQAHAEETFLAQPDRHPHRMVHYGHYVFRTPPPLAIFDPGLDPVTGQSIFLEGHRQNSAMFANSGASADLGGLSLLTPAIMYQLFGPLLIILLGHTAIAREREAGMLGPLLAQGIANGTLIAGKALALLGFVALLLIPLLPSAALALSQGGHGIAVLSLLGVYLVYLSIWAVLSLLISTVLQKRSTILTVLSALWLVMTLVIPAIAVNVATGSIPSMGKIETDLALQTDLRQLGDGHNSNDPSFKQLQADLFKQYNVQRVEDLPINFRGMVALTAEEDITDVLNKYAEARMLGEIRQAQLVADHGWIAPVLAIGNASRVISATDLRHYHRFLRQAEELRFEFVQGLNRAHIEELSYEDDINRSRNEASSLKARVDSSNWQAALNTFQFEPANAATRVAHASDSITILITWLSVLVGGLMLAGKRLKP